MTTYYCTKCNSIVNDIDDIKPAPHEKGFIKEFDHVEGESKVICYKLLHKTCGGEISKNFRKSNH